MTANGDKKTESVYCRKNNGMKSGIPEGGPLLSASIMQLEAGEQITCDKLTEKKERAADNTKNNPPVQNIEIPLPPMPLPVFARAPPVAQAGFACLAPTATREKA